MTAPALPWQRREVGRITAFPTAVVLVTVGEMVVADRTAAASL